MTLEVVRDQANLYAAGGWGRGRGAAGCCTTSRASEHLSGFARDVSVPMASVRASGEFAEGGVYYYAYYYTRGYGAVSGSAYVISARELEWQMPRVTLSL